MKFLIDECLSPELAQIARERGFGESTHVNWLGKSGAKDWELLPLIVDGGWTFVTLNAIDFRGPKTSPGSKGQYTRADIHQGLVCLSGPPEGTDLDLQRALFEHALAELERDGDLVNQVLEISIERVGEAPIVDRYPLPSK